MFYFTQNKIVHDIGAIYCTGNLADYLFTYKKAKPRFMGGTLLRKAIFRFLVPLKGWLASLAILK